MIIVVSAQSFPRYCLATDQLVCRGATQTTETNDMNDLSFDIRLFKTI